MKLNTHGTGMALGTFLVFWHLIWLICVGIGIAHGILNWVLMYHFIQTPFTMAPFTWGSAIVLLILVFVVGYIFGWTFAYVWNYFHKK